MTLITAIGYLWLVISILLVALLVMRRMENGRDPEEHLDDPSAPVANPIPRPSSVKVESVKVESGPDRADGRPDQGGPDIAVEERPGRVVAPPSILDLLDGVDLPHDLTPMTATVADQDRHAIFLSSHPDPEDVGTAFADELVRLGYEIEPVGLDQATASRDGDVLTMRITPKAAGIEDGGEPRYPTAGENDVAIEVWTGQGPPPPLAR